MSEVVPTDSRYVPMTQQPSCCAVTCILMVMYKRGIPLMPQEELGWHLGLVVSQENKQFFYNPRTSERPPSGYGTQIYKEEYHPNTVFPGLGIPLRLIYHPIDDFKDTVGLLEFINNKIDKDADLLACFDHGELKGDHKQGGHVCVIDRIKGQEVRLIESQPNQPKWRKVDTDALYKAMQFHGSDKMGGIWEFVKID